MKIYLKIYCFIAINMFSSMIFSKHHVVDFDPIREIRISLNEPDLNSLSRAYGYLKGQQYSLERIAVKFPDLKHKASRCEIEFKINFGKASDRINKALIEILGEKFEEFEVLFQSNIAEYQKDEDLTYDIANAFLDEVLNRAKGNIESPVLEVLLTYQFIDLPMMEHSKGFVNKYSTKNHPKAKGITMTIKLPKSWSLNEGDRPNIVQKFRSENGNGAESIILLIKDLDLPDNYVPSKEEIDEMFSNEYDLKGMIPEDAEYIYGKKIILEKQTGAEIAMKITRQRLDVTVTMQGVQYMTVYKNKFILCQCWVSAEKESALSERFYKFLPLFKMVANSIVFMDAY